MLIPAIDLQGGQVVQLVQGARRALAFDDLDAWIKRFAKYPLVQVIDLDAARNTGNNADLVRRACAALPCRVGGGVRTIARARELLDAGATEIIFGSALFKDGDVDTGLAAAIAASIGQARFFAAVDSCGGRVAVRAWTASVALTPVQAVRRLEPYVGGFLYTIVDGEGLMGGIDLDAVQQVRDATARRLTAAGGIRSRREIEQLQTMGVDAVVGMALYTGTLD